MTKKESRQLQILQFAREANSFMMQDLLNFFKNDPVTRMTLHRDLEELQKKGQMISKGEGRFTKYFIHRLHEYTRPVNLQEYYQENHIVRDIKEQFQWAVFDVFQDDIFTQDEAKRLEELQEKFQKKFQDYDSETLRKKEFERLMIEFAWKSSAIEGNTYTLLESETLLKDNIPSDARTSEEAQMLLNHKEVFSEIKENSERFQVLVRADIEYLHHILTKGLGVTRNIRKRAVGITGTKYVPLDNTYQIEDALEKTIKLINGKENIFEKSLLALVLLSYIQPFEDGNKRTARTVSNSILFAQGHVPLSYVNVDVDEYKRAMLLFYEQNNISAMKTIFLEQCDYAVKNYFG